MKLSPQWIRDYVDLTVDERRLAEDLTNVGISVEGISGTGAETVLEMEIGTNRPDAMNHYGVAREAAAIYDVPLKPIAPQLPSAAKAGVPAGSDGTTEVVPFPSVAAPNGRYSTTNESAFPIVVEEPALCPRFTALVIRNTQIRPSPEKIAHRLQLLDQRPISNAVDATNYVLWQIGKPTHVFDMDLLEGGKIVVRKARAGETLKTLDGVERKLSTEDLVVCDAKKPVGLAGVMGGWDTMITEKTRNVLIESAWWDPAIIRKMSRRHALHSDASHRFERGADFESTILSCDLVAQMILESGGGELIGDVVDVMSKKMDQAPVMLHVSEVQRILGTGLDARLIFSLLKRLGFVLIPEGQGDESFRVHIPSWRLDVEREIDVIEEIARLHGYNQFPNTLPAYSGAVVELPHAAMDAGLRGRALSLGYNEALSLSFISHADAEKFESGFEGTSGAKAPLGEASGDRSAEALRHPKSESGEHNAEGVRHPKVLRQPEVLGRPEAPSAAKAELSGTPDGTTEVVPFPSMVRPEGQIGARVLELENPLSEEASVMRTSLVPGMLDMLAWNVNRDVPEARLFEMASVYQLVSGERVEPRRACLGATAAAVRAGLPTGGALDVSKGEQAGAAEAFRAFKGDVENLLALFAGEVTYDRETAEYFHPGRSARARVNGATVAQFGQVHPEVAAGRKLRQDVFVAEFDLDCLHALGPRPVRVAPPPKFPAVERDFSFVFADGVSFEQMRDAVANIPTLPAQNAGRMGHPAGIPTLSRKERAIRMGQPGVSELRDFRPVEIFRGGSIGGGKYSILLRATFQSAERTLREEEVAQWSAKIVEVLTGLGGTQRA